MYSLLEFSLSNCGRLGVACNCFNQRQIREKQKEKGKRHEGTLKSQIEEQGWPQGVHRVARRKLVQLAVWPESTKKT